MKEHLYCLALGHNHSLCKAEIINVLNFRNIDFEVIEASQEVLIIRTDQVLTDLVTIDDFGSTSKLIEIFRTIPLIELTKNMLEGQADSEFFEYFMGEEPDKIKVFGVSVYGGGARFKDLNQSWFVAPRASQKIREDIVGYGHKLGFVPLKERILPSASVDNNKLLTRGFEMVLVVARDKVYIGKTVAVQDYKSYSFRDYKRPARDSKSGMIPPKLAKMMINLANKERDQVILDPFCGGGTILQEAILLGYKKVIGSDLSKEAVEGSRINIAWLFDNYTNLKKSDYEVRIFETDVKNLSVTLNKGNIDAIVTEPYLGSPKARSFSQNQIKNEINKLENLYIQAFLEFQKILNRYGRIVIIFPVFRFKQEFLHLEILDQLNKMGFVSNNFVPEKFLGEDVGELLDLQISKRNSIIYYRPDQTVSREIFIFSKK